MIRRTIEPGDRLPAGVAPAVVLIDPKFAHNVGGAVRAASCYGVKQVWFSGTRVSFERRLPREERMRGYANVDVYRCQRPFDAFANAVPVAVELRPGSELLPTFEHPANAVYVFGPEDGSIDKGIAALCHRFVVIPSKHCWNLASTVYAVLYDRTWKQWQNGEIVLPKPVDRGYFEHENV